jgi:hypothetical protein
MGLDMYLSKKTYVQNWNHTPEERKTKLTVKLGGKKHPAIDTKKVTYIQEEVAYWRKANHIHQWFVDNCQDGNDDCRESWVDREQLVELVELCKEIRDNCPLVKGKVQNGYTFGEDGEKIFNMVDGELMTNTEFAEERLPTQEGFFFGGTGYDQWYMQDILDTIKVLEAELKKYDELDKQGLGLGLPEYYYRSSW